MSKFNLCVITAIASLCWISAYSQTGPNIVAKKTKAVNLQVYFRQLCCDKTTELGADEVYIIVLGKSSTGQVYSGREPGPEAHWDMNDGNQGTDNPNGDSHCITNKQLFYGNIEDGETWWFNIQVGEEDGGTTRGIQEKAADILSMIDNPYAQGAAAILSVLNQFGFCFEDTDDWMGMIGVQVTNQGGQLQIHWNGKEGIVHSIPDPDDPGNPAKMEFRMNHDGSNYVGWFGVQPG